MCVYLHWGWLWGGTQQRGPFCPAGCHSILSSRTAPALLRHTQGRSCWVSYYTCRCTQSVREALRMFVKHIWRLVSESMPPPHPHPHQGPFMQNSYDVCLHRVIISIRPMRSLHLIQARPRCQAKVINHINIEGNTWNYFYYLVHITQSY